MNRLYPKWNHFPQGFYTFFDFVARSFNSTLQSRNAYVTQNIHNLSQPKINTSGFHFGISLLCILLFHLFSCNPQKACLPDEGFIAEQDTLYSCGICENISLQRYDTLYMEKGKCVKHPLTPQNSLAIIEEKDTVCIGIEPHATPFYFVQADIEMGFEYELLQLLMHQILPDIPVKFKPYLYSEMPQKLLKPQPEIVLMSGGYTKDTALQGVLWTNSYLDFHYALITRKADTNKYKTLADLAGKKVGIYKDKAVAKWVKKHQPSCQLFMAEDDKTTEFSEWMQMLVDKKVEAIVYDYPFAVNEIGDYREKLTISNAQLGDSTEMQHYVFGLANGGEGFLKMLNQSLYLIKKTPQYQQLVAKYIPSAKLSSAENPNWNDEDPHFRPKSRAEKTVAPTITVDSIEQNLGK
ncbi:MAG: substrate-binding periplasmic protein [Bacteroidia bacterium]